MVREAGEDVRGELTREPVDTPHVSVLLDEVVAALAPEDGQIFIDGTFGAGGYSRAILCAARCRVLAIDRDPSARQHSQRLVEEFGERFGLVEAEFGRLDEVAREAELASVDGVVLDIGVSSMQIDEAERGFSFQKDGPLDMRMSGRGLSAADVVNSKDEGELADIIYGLGEERRSRAIARAIVRQRLAQPFTRTSELAACVARVFHGRKVDGRHPATRTFQALRIYVNDELGELYRGLCAAGSILKPGGRLVVVTFHSLEDRMVKRFLTLTSGREARGSRHLPELPESGRGQSFRIVNPRPLSPEKGELEANPRARSARLRCAVRTQDPFVAPDRAEIGAPALG